ncbi:MAG: hypothetical protein K6T74_10500 [Geminicoccaceae bacterium]|nr:hypothetical protein [Geminicoccaceae bacterium]
MAWASPSAAARPPAGTAGSDPATEPELLGASAEVARSYATHIAREEGADDLPAVLGAPESLDARRHWRMYAFAEPLVRADPEGQWLTVGDSGGDAAALRRMGAQRVVASCISAARLRRLAARGLLDGVAIAELNAERLGPLEGPVDYLLCKEAYHHFPRAPLAFYGFLETARRAVVLIEPLDTGRTFPLEALRTLAKRWIRGDRPEDLLFEPWGNFIFRLSLPELHRMLTALQIGRYFVAYHNDFYHPHLSPRPVADRLAAGIERAGVAAKDLLARLGLMAYGKVAVVVPTSPLPEAAVRGLLAAGFRERRTPRNPYAAAAVRVIGG